MKNKKLEKILKNTQNKPVSEQLAIAILEILDEMESFEKEIEFTTSKVASLYPSIDEMRQKVKDLYEKKAIPGEKGDRGEPGENYILTEQDKKEIAKSIAVPVVEKVVEKIETIREIPQVTETIVKEIKEVEVFDEKKLPQYAVYYRDALELLPEGEKLTIEAIENLRKELDELKKLVSQRAQGGGIVGRDIIKSYDLSASLDGIATTFSIPATWYVISVVSSSMPHAMRPTIDFTWTQQTITFTSEIDPSTVLASGQSVIITYVTS